MARAQIGLQGPSPNGLRRRPLNPDLGARHDVVWSRAGSLSSGNPSGMRTVSSSVRRTPAAGRCELSRGACGGRTRAGRPRGAQTHHVALRRARRARCRGARPRPCHHEVEVAGRGRWRTCRSKRRRERCGRAPCGAGCGLDDHGGRVAALHVREGRAPSFTAARAPAWPTTWGQVCLVGDGGAFKSESRS